MSLELCIWVRPSLTPSLRLALYLSYFTRPSCLTRVCVCVCVCVCARREVVRYWSSLGLDLFWHGASCISAFRLHCRELSGDLSHVSHTHTHSTELSDSQHTHTHTHSTELSDSQHSTTLSDSQHRHKHSTHISDSRHSTLTHTHAHTHTHTHSHTHTLYFCNILPLASDPIR